MESQSEKLRLFLETKRSEATTIVFVLAQVKQWQPQHLLSANFFDVVAPSVK